MKQVFDLIEAIGEKVIEYAERTGYKPTAISISRGSYRRILEIKASETRIGNLTIGCASCWQKKQSRQNSSRKNES